MGPTNLSFLRSNVTGCALPAKLARSSNVHVYTVCSLASYSQTQSWSEADIGLTAIDAVPKKRGPKTDVLEALLKRVDGLEKRLKDQKKEQHSNEDEAGSSETSKNGSGNGTSPIAEQAAAVSPTTADVPATANAGTSGNGPAGNSKKRKNPPSSNASSSANGIEGSETHPSPRSSRDSKPAVQTEALLETYFRRFHAKPFHILDESSFRQRLQLHQIPSYLLSAVCGLASRYVLSPISLPTDVAFG